MRCRYCSATDGLMRSVDGTYLCNDGSACVERTNPKAVWARVCAILSGEEAEPSADAQLHAEAA